MDPVYAGTIAGMVLLFGGVVMGCGIFIYKECTLRPSETHYSPV